MTRPASAAEQLRQISDELLEQGRPDIAGRLRDVIDTLGRQAVMEPAGNVMTTGEAARVLGVRSVNTIKKWVMDGLLEGFLRGDRILVSRESVERMLSAPALHERKAREARLAEAAEAFDAGDEEVPRHTLEGRKPWTKDV